MLWEVKPSGYGTDRTRGQRMKISDKHDDWEATRFVWSRGYRTWVERRRARKGAWGQGGDCMLGRGWGTRFS